MGSAPSRLRRREVRPRQIEVRPGPMRSKVTDFMEGGGKPHEQLFFNPETGKLEVLDEEEAYRKSGRQVVTAMSKKDGGGFFVLLIFTIIT